MNVIIAGATGAVGMALLEECLKNQDRVLVLARKDSKRLDRLPKHPLVEICFCALEELKNLQNMTGRNYDVFYHFAWAGTTGAARNDMYLQNKNVEYALDAVEAARRFGCHTFIGAGSQAEYGRVEGKLCADTPVNPENGYGMAKLCAGLMTREVCRKYGIKHIWPRILSVYGPYDGKQSMIMSAINSLLDGEIPGFTKGEQKWDYLYSKDAAAILHELPIKGVDGKVYCLGSGQVRPLAEYIEILRQTADPSGVVEMGGIPYAEKQVMYLCADTSAIEADLGYTCRYSFEDGMKETCDWIKKERENAKNKRNDSML